MRISDWSSDVCSSDLFGEVCLQRLGTGAVAGRLQAAREFRHRAHHPRRRPPSDEQRQQGEYDDRPVQRTVETLLASHRLGHVVSEEEPFVRRLPDRQLVGERDAVFVHTAEVVDAVRSEEHTSELQSLMRISYAVLCWNK